MGSSNVVDQLLNQNGLADTGTAEQTDLATLGIGADQVNDLDAGLQNFGGGFLFVKGRGRTVDGPVLRILGGRLLINGIAEQVEYAAEALVTDGDLDGFTGIDRIRTADKAVCGGHRNAADHIVTDVLGNLNDQLFCRCSPAR